MCWDKDAIDVTMVHTYAVYQCTPIIFSGEETHIQRVFLVQCGDESIVIDFSMLN